MTSPCEMYTPSLGSTISIHLPWTTKNATRKNPLLRHGLRYVEENHQPDNKRPSHTFKTVESWQDCLDFVWKFSQTDEREKAAAAFARRIVDLAG
jgi:hypothetical protein